MLVRQPAAARHALSPVGPGGGGEGPMKIRRYRPPLPAVAALGITAALATPSSAATTADKTPPSVVSTTPRNGAVDQPTTTAPTATFSEAVQASTISYTFTAGATSVPSQVSYNTSTFTA